MTEVFLSLGSNIHPEYHLLSALSQLEQSFGRMLVSSVYETEAVGFEGPVFHNIAVAFYTDWTLEKVVEIIAQIEQEHGRTEEWKKYTSRPLDIDLLLYGDLIQSTTKPVLPREDITRYAFVLEPLAEIAPTKLHPITKECYADLWQKFDKTHCVQKKQDGFYLKRFLEENAVSN